MTKIIFSILMPLSLNSVAHAVINGVVVKSRTQGPARAVVYLELLRGKDPSTFCTGTLIKKNAVLTAAHCFDKSMDPELSGFNVIIERFNNGEKTRVVLLGRKYIQYPGYLRHEEYTENDIAVAQFSGDLPLDASPAPYDKDGEADYSQQRVEVYGYGRSEDYTGRPGEDLWKTMGVLRKGTILIGNGYRTYNDNYRMDPNNKNFLCQGDSGGPQFLIQGHSYKIVGVNAGSGPGKILKAGMRSCKSPGAAMKVSVYAEWITQQIRWWR
jgi:tryptase